MATVRICHPNDYPGFLELVDKEEALFRGPASSDINNLMDSIKKKNNGSIIIHSNHGVGQLVNGSYDGCLGRLQRNESDLALTPVDYPLEGLTIDQGILLYDTTVTFIQDYFLADFKKQEVQLLSSVNTMSCVFPLIICFIVSCLVIFKTREKIFRRRGRRANSVLRRLTNIILHCSRLTDQ